MKILFLQKRLLFPTDSGGKIRTLNILRHLANWHDVTYLCNVSQSESEFLDDMRSLGMEVITIPWNEAKRGSSRFYRDLALNVLSPFPFNVDKDYDPRLRQQAKNQIESKQFDLLICDFVQMARNCIGFKQIPMLLFQHNVESQIFQRHANSNSSLLRRAYMWLQWKKMHRFENRVGDEFNRVVAVSQRDRELFEAKFGWQHVDVVDTAVNTEFFQPNPNPAISRRCAFVGSMDWLPNEGAVLYFAREIWPSVRAKFPDATFMIVGRNPPHSVRALENQNGISVTGSVPDVRPYMAEAEVIVVPLLVGGGTRLKVFEAMAMGKPIVSTSLGAEGLNVSHENNILLADSPDAFQSEISRLFLSTELRKRIAAEALSMVQGYTSEKVARQFEEICTKTIASHASQNLSD